MIKRFATCSLGAVHGAMLGRLLDCSLAVAAVIDKEKSNGLDEDLEPGLERQ
jgi:hypothetical protein